MYPVSDSDLERVRCRDPARRADMHAGCAPVLIPGMLVYNDNQHALFRVKAVHYESERPANNNNAAIRAGLWFTGVKREGP